MNDKAALAQLPLRDIHLPPAPAWWPPAPGWWLLAFIGLVAAGWMLRSLQRRWRAHRRRRRLLAEFDREVARFESTTQAIERLRCAVDLLRRACRRDAAHALRLRDQAWLDYLDRGLPGQPFSRGVGAVLLEAPYRPDCAPELAEQAVRLIRRRLQAGLP